MARTRGGVSGHRASRPRSTQTRAPRVEFKPVETLIPQTPPAAKSGMSETSTLTYTITPFIYNLLKSIKVGSEGENVGDYRDLTRPVMKNWELVEHDPEPIKVDRREFREEKESVSGEQTSDHPIGGSGSVPEPSTPKSSIPDWMDFGGLEDRPEAPETEEAQSSKKPSEPIFWVESTSSSSSSSSSDDDEPLIFRFKRTRPTPETTTPPSTKRVKHVATKGSSAAPFPRRPRTRSSGPAVPMTLPTEKLSPPRPKKKTPSPSQSKKSTTPSSKTVPRSSKKRTVSAQKHESGTVPASAVSEKAPATTPPQPSIPPSDSYIKFLQRTVVRGKIVRPGYFKEQGLGGFLEKLEKQGWLELFSDGTHSCSAPDLAEFYANCAVSNGVVTSTVGECTIRLDAGELGKLLGVPAEGFGIYVREAKSAIGRERLLEVCRKLAQKPELDIPRTVLKREMTPMNRLLYWFVIKNIIPRGQGRNKADVLDMVLVDLLDTGSQINLPALMISHISRMADPKREHDLGYGFLLTMVLERSGVVLQKRAPAQANDEISTRTLLSCGFLGTKEGTSAGQEQSPQTVPVLPVPAPAAAETVSEQPSSSSTPSLDTVIADQQRMQGEFDALKELVILEQAINIQRHEALLTALKELTAKFTPPS